MALSSLYKQFSERLCGFSNWKFNFQKTRVIGSLTYLDEALEKMSTSPFFVKFNRAEYFYNSYGAGRTAHRWALFFEEAVFLNSIVNHWTFDRSKLTPYEAKDYDMAVEKLRTWHDLAHFMRTIELFIGEIKRVYYLRRVSEFPASHFAYKFPEYELSIVARYHAVVEKLEPYPEWQAKFKNEVEPVIKQLADMAPTDLSSLKFDVFFGINLHSHFR